VSVLTAITFTPSSSNFFASAATAANSVGHTKVKSAG
jgi:hypothetical protein